MTIHTDLLERPKPHIPERKVLSFAQTPAAAAPAEKAALDYSDVELSQSAEASDFDLQTIAILGGIVIFKLSMLGLLLMSL